MPLINLIATPRSLSYLINLISRGIPNPSFKQGNQAKS